MHQHNFCSWGHGIRAPGEGTGKTRSSKEEAIKVVLQGPDLDAGLVGDAPLAGITQGREGGREFFRTVDALG